VGDVYPGICRGDCCRVFLAFSVDRIAALTGVASSTLGILAASIVTTLPEAAATIAAARIGASDLGIDNLYGSCAFNVAILLYADPFYRQGIIVIGVTQLVQGGRRDGPGIGEPHHVQWQL
jgi:hypothetical protein